MSIGPEELKSAMDTLLSKLHSLLQPLFEGAAPQLSPSQHELRIARGLTKWITDLLTGSADTAEMMSHSPWPNVNAWDSFIRGLKGLRLPHPIGQAEYDGELDNLIAARAELLLVAQRLMKTSPCADDKMRAGKRIFLADEGDRAFYRKHVLTYYNMFVCGKGLSHQEEMVHYAAIYQTIASYTNLGKDAFCGPDFDDFMLTYCGIEYNGDKKTKRGRYRQVEIVRAACIPNFSHSANKHTIKPKLVRLFSIQCMEFRRIIGKPKFDARSQAQVPRGF